MHAPRMTYVCMYVYFQPESDLTIIQLEKRLRQCVETMSKEKQERLKLMKSRMKVDQHLCDALNAIPYYIPTGSVPTDQQLDELEQHIRDLESEQVHISSLSALCRSMAVIIQAVISLGPGTWLFLSSRSTVSAMMSAVLQTVATAFFDQQLTKRVIPYTRNTFGDRSFAAADS